MLENTVANFGEDERTGNIEAGRRLIYSAGSGNDTKIPE
jgi:hypothetical protein